MPAGTWRNLVPLLDYHSCIRLHGKYSRVRLKARIINRVRENHSGIWALGSWFGSEGQVPCVTWHFSGRCGGLQGDGGVIWSRGGRRLLFGVRLETEVRQRQRDGSNVVDSQQDLQGADLLKALICQRLARPLNLLNTRRERTHPTSWKRSDRDQDNSLKKMGLKMFSVRPVWVDSPNCLTNLL